MKDNYGQELKVGDKVAYIYTFGGTSHHLKVGTIKEIIKRFGQDRAVLDRYNEYVCTSVETQRILKLPDIIRVEDMEQKYNETHDEYDRLRV